jgi:hypothetical protein
MIKGFAPLMRLLSIRLSPQAGKSLLISHKGRGRKRHANTD